MSENTTTLLALGGMVLGGALIVMLIDLPAQIAAAKNHPSVWGIRLLAWLGILFLGAGWFAALIWACSIEARERRH